MNSVVSKGVIANCKRTGTRFDCAHDCRLFHDGTLYQCRMKNISISGALICGDNFPPSTIKIGDTCHLSLHSDLPSDNGGGYTSKVTRFDISHIGVHFLSIAI
ncbi:MAG: PilZ domain-containing protein [Desulfuromonadaceae bacterium]